MFLPSYGFYKAINKSLRISANKEYIKIFDKPEYPTDSTTEVNSSQIDCIHLFYNNRRVFLTHP